MNIDVAYGRDIDDSMLEQLLYMEADACVFYDRLDSNSNPNEILIGIIPTETLKHFKRRVSNTLFLMRTQKKAGKKHLIGMACISNRGRGNEKYLHTVYVKPFHRDKGIGRALVQKAILIAKKNKQHLFLSVNPLNKIAVNLYESLGFNISKGQSITMDFDASKKTINKKAAK